MNVSLMRRIADAIEEEPLAYNQKDFGSGKPPTCKTACCVGGWAVYLATDEEREKLATSKRYLSSLDKDGQVRRGLGDEAAILLDLEHDDSRRLFECYWPTGWFYQAGISEEDITSRVDGVEIACPLADQAAKILRGMAKDKIVWEGVNPLRATF